MKFTLVYTKIWVGILLMPCCANKVIVILNESIRCGTKPTQHTSKMRQDCCCLLPFFQATSIYAGQMRGCSHQPGVGMMDDDDARLPFGPWWVTEYWMECNTEGPWGLIACSFQLVSINYRHLALINTWLYNDSSRYNLAAAASAAAAKEIRKAKALPCQLMTWITILSVWGSGLSYGPSGEGIEWCWWSRYLS